MKLVLTFILLSLVGFAKSPFFELNVNGLEEPTQIVQVLNMSIFLALLFLLPSLILITTSFTRIVIVLALLKQALGLQQLPPSKILISMALIITIFIMKPFGLEAYNNGIKPYVEKKIDYIEAFEKSAEPFKRFMYQNTREKDLALFYRIKNIENPKNIEDIDITALIPAFMISELRTAFEIGLLLFIPFIIIDVIVSTVLMALGMMMLPPTLISMPIKIAFFVIIDGWGLIIGQLAESFKI